MLTLVFLVIQEAEIRGIEVRDQPGQIVLEILLKIPNTRKGWCIDSNSRALI
jgi:hypothetical protein